MKIRTLKFHRARNYDYWLISEYSEKFPRNKTEAKKKKKVGTNEERQISIFNHCVTYMESSITKDS